MFHCNDLIKHLALRKTEVNIELMRAIKLLETKVILVTVTKKRNKLKIHMK